VLPCGTRIGTVMAANRVFFPQQALDTWLEAGRGSLVGDELTILPEARRFRLTSAVRFTAEVAEGRDPNDLVGKVKDLEQLAALGGEHSSQSVIIGDNAYDVIEGFLGEPLPAVKKGAGRRSAAGGKPPPSTDPNDPLNRLLAQR
jgi:hypothetical protein